MTVADDDSTGLTRPDSVDATEIIPAIRDDEPPAAADGSRQGPQVLDADSWDTAPDGVANPAYAGRRRAQAPPARLWAVSALVVIGLTAAVAIPVVLVTGRGGEAAPEPTAIAAGTPEPTTAPPTTKPPATAKPTSTPKTTPKPPRPPKPPAPAFKPVTLEAEFGQLDGDAEIVQLGGKKVVQGLGDWSDVRQGRWDDGTLRLTVSIPAKARYTLTIHFVHPYGDEHRTAIVSVTGVDNRSVSFDGNEQCCRTKALTGFELSKGTKTITISNPNGHAPAIDKIVITRA